MTVLFLVLWWMEFRFMVLQKDYEIYIGFLAVFFLLFGLWLSSKITRPKVETIVLEKKILVPETDFVFNQTEFQERNISKRELEVLTLIAKGMSNQEIAETLFVSLNTVKTHTAKLFEKLEVKRRTQAIETAKKLQLLPPTVVWLYKNHPKVWVEKPDFNPSLQPNPKLFIMKNTIVKYGLIAGLIVTAFMGIGAGVYMYNPEYDLGMVFGFAGMLVAYTFVFLGVKNYRDKQNDGFITFGKAFKVGMLMSLITATIYVGTWMVEHHFIFPDFMEKYSENSIIALEKQGLPAAEFQAEKEKILYYKELYKNPLWIILFTYMEIMIPIGLLVPVISAAILKRKPTTVV